MISIQCSISGGDMPIGVIWKLNNVLIPNDHHDILLDRRGQRVHTLNIEAVTEKHIGNYTCSATNRAGTVEFTSTLLVNGLNFLFTNFLECLNQLSLDSKFAFSFNLI